MKAADYFVAVATLPIGSFWDITRGGGLVIVAPHPDDESLGCGGLIAEACSQGVDVRLIVISDGVGSHPASRRYPPEKLRALRETETWRAVAELGLPSKAICFLGLPDTNVPTDGPGAEAACKVIVDIALECRARAVCVTWRQDPHCDHNAAAALVARARPCLGDARILAYPVWGWTLTPDTEVGAPPTGLRFQVAPHAEAKAAAIAAHQSQTTDLIDDDPNGFRLTPDMLAHFAGSFEFFLDADEESPSMSRYEASMPSSYFDDLYAGDPDPWRFAANAYERDKYVATIASLSKGRYRNAFEVGCSIGVLTRQLASRCEAMLSVDVAKAALDRAVHRCADLTQVRFAEMRVPGDWPVERFDLILLSEVLYFLDQADVEQLAVKVGDSLEPGGDIVLVHWLGETNYPLSGDQAADFFIAKATPFASVHSSSRREAYRLDVLRR